MTKTFYMVLSKQGDAEIIETIRTDKKAAQEDVGLLGDIVRRHAWIIELEI